MGDPRPRAARRRAPRSRRRRPARGRVHRRRAVRRRRAAPASAPRWAPARRPIAASTSRSPRCSKARDHYFVVEVGSERGAEVLGELPHAPAGGRRAGGRRATRTRARPRRWAASSTAATSGSCCTATTSTRAGTRSPSAASRAGTARWCARPASARASRTSPISPESTVERDQRWDSCFTVDYSYIHGGAVRGSHALALPPVDDPQARHLDRPVRKLRLRRAADAASPGARSGSTSPRRRARSARARCEAPMQTTRGADRRRAGVRGPRAAPAGGDRRLRRATKRFAAGDLLFAEGDAADRFFLIRRGVVALEVDAPGPGAAASWRRSRAARSSAGRGCSSPTAGSFDARAPPGHAAWSPSTAPACAASAEADHELGYQLMRRFAPRPRPSTSRRPACSCSTSTAMPASPDGLARAARAPMAPQPFAVTGKRRETADTWTLELEADRRARDALRARAVHDALRGRRRRGADLDQRRSGPGGRSCTRCAPSELATAALCESSGERS